MNARLSFSGKSAWWFAAGVLLLLLLCHRSVLWGIGNWLVVEDPVQPVDALYILSGNSFDRGEEAARLYHEGYAPLLVCLGGETNPALELYGIDDLTSTMTRGVLLRAGVPAGDAVLLPEGTSTFEEFQAIVRHCKANGFQRIMVVSSLFHTRRIHTYFRTRLYLEGIELVLRGASESSFEEDEWWKEEPGLLFVNSEYIKMVYYWLKY